MTVYMYILYAAVRLVTLFYQESLEWMQKSDYENREEGNAFLMDNIAILSVLQMRRETFASCSCP